MSQQTDALDFNSPSVQSYLNILQAIINRMAANSASTKTWCITIVSAVIVIIADKGKPQYVWISIIPLVLFLILDAYYLGLERQFRQVYNNFIRKLHYKSASIEDVFIIAPSGEMKGIFTSTIQAILSVSIWPFYGLLLLMLFVVRYRVL